MENDAPWRRIGQLRPIGAIRRTRANRPSNDALEMRNNLKRYFMEEGAIEWQMRMIEHEEGDEEMDVE